MESPICSRNNIIVFGECAVGVPDFFPPPPFTPPPSSSSLLSASFSSYNVVASSPPPPPQSITVPFPSLPPSLGPQSPTPEEKERKEKEERLKKTANSKEGRTPAFPPPLSASFATAKFLSRVPQTKVPSLPPLFLRERRNNAISPSLLFNRSVAHLLPFPSWSGERAELFYFQREKHVERNGGEGGFL